MVFSLGSHGGGGAEANIDGINTRALLTGRNPTEKLSKSENGHQKRDL